MALPALTITAAPAAHAAPEPALLPALQAVAEGEGAVVAEAPALCATWTGNAVTGQIVLMVSRLGGAIL